MLRYYHQLTCIYVSLYIYRFKESLKVKHAFPKLKLQLVNPFSFTVILLGFHACIYIITNQAARNTMHINFYAVAKVNGNEMLKTYHRGAYGSKNPEEWSCCGYSGQSHEGCFSVSVDTIVHPRQPTRKSSQTDQEELSIVKVPPDSTKRGLRFVISIIVMQGALLTWSIFHIGRHTRLTAPVLNQCPNTMDACINHKVLIVL